MRGHPWQWYGGHTYAQHGEDLILLNIFKKLGIEKPGYLDIGAHDPYVISNTALLYERGARGINVDANARLIETFRERRPFDVNLAVGVAPKAGRLPFYMLSERSGLNSFVRAEVEARGAAFTETMVDCVTVNELVDRHAGGRFPNILSIDVEGLDVEILRGIEFGAGGPDVIVAEARGNGREVAGILEGRFRPAFRAGSNLILVHVRHGEWVL